MAEENIVPLNPGVMKKLGQKLYAKWEVRRNDRKAFEEKALQNLRQFRGIYDPDILKNIPADRSKAYPKLTRWKVIGTVARLMQMLFPQTEKNWAIAPSPLPNLGVDALQSVLDTLQQTKATEKNIPLDQVECTDEEIEKAVMTYAEQRAKRMSVKIEDDLQEMEFTTLARRVVFSSVLYNIGLLKGPMNIKYRARTWSKDLTGRYKAQEVDKVRPLMEFLPIWNWYGDFTAKTLTSQDGEFERHVMVRSEVQDLAERPDFIAANITEWLDQHKDGNWKPEHWETSLSAERKSDRNKAGNTSDRKYVVLAYWGEITGDDLAAAGAKVAEADLGKTFTGNVWMLENTIIKACVSVLNAKAQHHHYFVFEDDDLSLTGNGQCDTLRDSQLSLCEATRMLLDEGSLGGENLIVNLEKLAPGQDTNPASHKVWLEESEGAAANVPAVRPLARESRVGELQSMVEMFQSIADKESGLPPPSLGDVSGGGSEALRTQQNASMFLGAAALPIRDTVRNYDTFTISVIKSLVEWNMKYDPNPERDGDYMPIARGSTSLIAKEVLAQSLDVFKTTLDPEERAHVDIRELLKRRAVARDIPIDDGLLLPEEVAKANIAAQQHMQQTQADAAVEEIASKVRLNLATSLKAAAEARKADASVTIDAFELIMNALMEGLHGGGSKEGGARSAAPAASQSAG